ncbi:hypothetical protein MKZ38_004580 [Zalerion maritima]|uniref:Uncharacterized protein n=1 Tax=Zalerion maritima TaxID=339359 RepID=A0AAD5WV01_9PEZI|nr:hypothetical protein MKZ38_004580 [Zalerion maritima]
MLDANLKLLLKVFENPVNEDTIKTQVSEFINILDILQSIAHSCAKCARALDIDLARAAIATKRAETHGRRFIKRIWAFNRFPDIVVEIQRKATQLQQVCNAVSTVIVNDIRTQQGRTSAKETVESTSIGQKTPLHENLNVSMDFASIDQMVGPIKNSFNNMLHDNDNFSSSIMPEFDSTLLGPSKVFADPPKIGEKVQIEYDGLWYDSRVTVVDSDEIRDDSRDDERDSGSLFFPEEQLTQLGKGKRRLWRPWRRNITQYDVRPYRCFHIGDSVEAPVMYPDFRFHYHVTDNSQLYLENEASMDPLVCAKLDHFLPHLLLHTAYITRQGGEDTSVPVSAILKVLPESCVDVEIDVKQIINHFRDWSQTTCLSAHHCQLDCRGPMNLKGKGQRTGGNDEIQFFQAPNLLSFYLSTNTVGLQNP